MVLPGAIQGRPQKWERGQATCSGQGRRTHGEGKHTVRGDVDKVVARDGRGRERSPWPQWG